MVIDLHGSWYFILFNIICCPERNSKPKFKKIIIIVISKIYLFNLNIFRQLKNSGQWYKT